VTTQKGMVTFKSFDTSPKRIPTIVIVIDKIWTWVWCHRPCCILKKRSASN